MKKEDLSEGISKVNELIKNIKEQLDALYEKRKDLGLKLEEEKKRQNNVRSEIQVKTSRLRMLKEMEKTLRVITGVSRLFCRHASNPWIFEGGFMVHWHN